VLSITARAHSKFILHHTKGNNYAEWHQRDQENRQSHQKYRTLFQSLQAAIIEAAPIPNGYQHHRKCQTEV
jgi:hypothetical protein